MLRRSLTFAQIHIGVAVLSWGLSLWVHWASLTLYQFWATSLCLAGAGFANSRSLDLTVETLDGIKPFSGAAKRARVLSVMLMGGSVMMVVESYLGYTAPETALICQVVAVVLLADLCWLGHRLGRLFDGVLATPSPLRHAYRLANHILGDEDDW